MKFIFQKKHEELLKQVGFNFDVNQEISEEQYEELMEKIPDYLMMHGFDSNYLPNEVGVICEEIITILTNDN